MQPVQSVRPFSITPNPDALFLTNSLNSTIAKVQYVIEEKQGLSCIFGPVGMGKSSVLRKIHQGLVESSHVTPCLVTNPTFSSDAMFLKSLCLEFNLPPRRSTHDQEKEMKAFLIDQAEQGRTVAVLIDEAQRLTGPMLERIRALLNYETAHEKLIQIVLCGEESTLNAKLEEPTKKGLKSRIVTRSTLTSLDPAEAVAVVEFRCRLAGVSNPFTETQILQFYSATTGTPRGILALCGQAYELISRKVPVQAAVNEALKDWR